MPIEVHLNGYAVIGLLVTGGTTITVACMKAASRVAVAWIWASHGQSPPPPEDEPPDALGGLPQLHVERQPGDHRNPGAARG